MLFSKATVATLLFSLGLSYPTDGQDRNVTDLKWVPCDLDFPLSHQKIIAEHGAPVFCASLQVPLDYTDTKRDEILELQLVKVEATREPFKGSIIMNPGGPGASGVEEISKKGPMYRDILGGHFDVIGFDARGTGRTMPFACLPPDTTTSTVSRRSTNFTIPQADMYSTLTGKAWNDAGVFVDWCTDTEGNANVARYLSTPFVARDMLHIVDALNEDGLLRFWGRSYSTVLGQTFASMFPDRVGGILLDSVVRFDDYFSGQWLTANRDTEVALLNFFRECVIAGTEACPLANYTGPGTTPETLQKELAKVFQELLDNPIILPDWYQPGAQLYLYRPDQYLILYTLIDAAFKRDWNSWLQPPSTSSPENATTPEIPWNLGLNAFHAIACSDTPFRAKKSEDMYSLTRAQTAQGSWSDVFAPQTWVCAQWKFEAAEQYSDPFTNISTRVPLLMVNGAHDPITPLSAAFEASVNFKGSRMLVHNGHGHGLMNHPSACTIKAIHDYFNDGTLPNVGKVCQPDQTAYEIALEAVTGSFGNDTIETRSASSMGTLRLAQQGLKSAKQVVESRSFETKSGIWLN